MAIRLKPIFLFTLVVLQTVTTSALADPTFDQVTPEPSITDRVIQELDETWQAQDYEWYIPINTWHNRSTYSREEIAEYNEQPWGLGIGKYRYDLQGDWHGMYAMVFLDSNSKLEPIVGYAYQKTWETTPNIRLGLGYSVGLTLRHDLDYLPLPLIVPLASIKYRSVALQATYVPGANNSGNVLFTWLRWEMP